MRIVGCLCFSGVSVGTTLYRPGVAAGRTAAQWVSAARPPAERTVFISRRPAVISSHIIGYKHRPAGRQAQPGQPWSAGRRSQISRLLISRNKLLKLGRAQKSDYVIQSESCLRSVCMKNKQAGARYELIVKKENNERRTV